MSLRLLFFALTCLLQSYGMAQRLEGKIKNESGEPLQATILLKDLKNSEIITDIYQSNEQGIFDFSVQNTPSKIIFEIRAMGYGSYKDSIIDPIAKIYHYDLVLKTEVFELEEVIIATERKIIIKKDTTEFYPKSFLNGTERKVEDLLKRLPGLEVSDNGKIKYLGKNVESVQLDGDDLFGDKYSIGTKNIAVDLVEKIQAIDNFTANPLLKNLVGSESVSLNIVLKNAKTKFNLDGTIGIGLGDKKVFRRDIALNYLTFNNSFKSFGNVSHNNRGINNSVFDYYTYSSDGDGTFGQEHIAKKTIPVSNISSDINTANARINNEYSASYNFLYRFSKKLLFKSNLFFAQDLLTKTETSRVDFVKESFNYNDESQSKNKPINKQLSGKFEYAINTKNLLTFEAKYRIENSDFKASVLQNQVFNINNHVFSNTKFWNNLLEYTHKINDNSAFQLKSNYATSRVSQDFLIVSNIKDYIGDNQQSLNQLDYIHNQLMFFVRKNKVKLNVTLGNTASINKFKTDLTKENNNVIGFENDFNFTAKTVFSEFDLYYKNKVWEFKPSFKVVVFDNQISYNTDNQTIRKEVFVGMPKLSIAFNPSPNHKVYFTSELSYSPATTQNLFLNGILEGNRSIKKNILSLDLQQSEQYNLHYRYHDLFNSFTTFIGMNVRKDFNTYLNNLTFDKNYTFLTYFRVPTNIINNSVNIGIEKLVAKISIKFSNTIGQMNYKNIVNNSDLRNNNSTYQTYNLFLKTGFSLPIGCENAFLISNNQFKVNGQMSNELLSWSNTFKLIYKIDKKLMFVTSLNSITPQVGKTTNFNFLNFEINLKPKFKNKVIEYHLTVNNLFNTRFYKTTENSDFAITQYQSNLIGRYFLASVGFRF